MFNTIFWHLNVWRLMALGRFVLYLIFRRWVSTGMYEHTEHGYLGWKELPVFGVVAFIRDDGSLQFWW